MDGKAQIQNHQEKPSHHCSVSKRVKAKFKFENVSLFSKPEKKNSPTTFPHYSEFPENSHKKIPPSP